MLDVSVIVLSKNESHHIRRCIEDLRALDPAAIFVIDCFSTDGTAEIAESLGAVVIKHEWPGLYAKQFNWALDNAPIKTKWVLRMDADEYLTPEAIVEAKSILQNVPDDVSSLSLPLARTFMGERVAKGVSTVILRRFFRFGIGRCEERMMDEHIITTSGRDIVMKNPFVDDNLNKMRWWSEKHLGYAIREAVDLLNIEYGILESDDHVSGQARQKRNLKNKYAGMPLYWRALLYFILRYFVKGGFLEGRRGFRWHFFQGLWYRMYVDATIDEIKMAARKRDPNHMRDAVIAVLKEQYGMLK